MESTNIFVKNTSQNVEVKRKFLAESGINLYSSGANVFRPADLYRYGKDKNVRAALEGCNIYLICRRRRISVDPFRLRVSDGLLHGQFRLHGESLFEFESFPFSQKKLMIDQNGQPLRLHAVAENNSLGFDVMVKDQYNRVGVIPAHALIADSNHGLKDNTSLDVLYVGLAYGTHGKRLAVDRLVDHTTLQRILAESAETNPCDEVLLLFFRYEHAKIYLSTAGDNAVEPAASEREERSHIQSSGNIMLNRKTRIMLAEAALINYFKPPYNVVHKQSFQPYRMKRLKTLRDLFEQDLSALIVEINTSNFKSKLFSKNAPAKKPEDIFDAATLERLKSKGWFSEQGISESEASEFFNDMIHAHIAKFPLYEKSERESFLHALPWS